MAAGPRVSFQRFPRTVLKLQSSVEGFLKSFGLSCSTPCVPCHVQGYGEWLRRPTAVSVSSLCWKTGLRRRQLS